MTTDFEILEINNSEQEHSELISLSKEIREKYPFTLMDKENIQVRIDQFDSPVWVEDANGGIILSNNEYSKKFNNKKNLGLTENYTNSFYKNFGKLSKLINECTEINDDPVSIKLKILLADGKPGLINICRVPLKNENGQKFSFLIRMKIVSETEWIKSENILTDYYLDFIDHFTREYLIIDQERKILMISEELKSILGESDNLDSDLLIDDVFSEEVVKTVNDLDNRRLKSLEKDYQGLLSEKLNRYFNGKVFIYLLPGKRRIYLISFINSLHQKEIVSILGKEKMIESLMHNNPEPIYIFDKENLTFLDANKAAIDLYGYSKEEFLQMDITDLYLPEDIQTLLDNSEEKQAASFFTGPYRQRKKDGSLILVELSKNLWTYEGRDSYLNIIRDVTGIKNLEKKVQLFKNVFDNTDDLLFVTDTDGIITYVNNPATKTLGYSKEDLENSAFSALLVDEERANVNANIFHSYLKDSITVVTELKKSDDSHLQVELTASPVLDYKNEIDSFSIIATVNKDFQQVTHEVIKEVVKEIRIEKPLNIHAIESQSDEPVFLSSLFHQILTPINVIMGFVQELTESLPNLSTDHKEMVDIINQNRSTLLGTMNSFVEYSNIVQNKYDISIGEILVTELIDDLHKNFKEITGSDTIEFAYGKISSSLTFESDQKKIISFISQLIKILLKLKKSKKIFFSAYQYDDKNFIISVKDNYPIASDLIVNSFDILFSEQPRTDKKDLGLPRLSTQLSAILLQILKGKFQIINDEPSKFDYGFIFPLKHIATETIEPLVMETKVEEPKIIPQQSPAADLDEQKLIEPEKVSADINISEIAEDIPNVEQNNGTKIVSPVEQQPITQEIEMVIPPIVEEKPKEIIPAETTVNKSVAPEINIEEAPLPEEPVPSLKIIEQKPASTVDLSKLSCLYIEDQVDSQILFKVQLKELKSINFAAGFEEALPILEKNKFDFIVMDINLQGEYNGLDALRLIHKMSQYEKIPIIAVTAYVLPGDKEKFIATGFHDFIAKPIFHDKMIESLQKIFHF